MGSRVRRRDEVGRKGGASAPPARAKSPSGLRAGVGGIPLMAMGGRETMARMASAAPTARTEFQGKWQWKAADAAGLRAPLEQYILPILPATASANGTVDQSEAGSTIQKRLQFSSAAGWLDALGMPSSSYSLWVSAQDAYLSISVRGQSLEITVRTEPTRDAEVRGRIAAFEAAAKLKAVPLGPQAATTGGKSRRNVNYRTLDLFGFEDFKNAVRLASDWIGEPTYWRGSWALEASPDVMHDEDSAEDWGRKVEKKWGELASATVNANGRERSVGVNLQQTNRSLSIYATAGDEAQLASLFGEVEKQTKIAVHTAPVVNTQPVKQDRRSFYLANPIDAAWTEKFVGTVRGAAAQSNFFGGGFEQAGQMFTAPKAEDWEQQVRAHWREMKRFSCSFTAGAYNHALDVDPVREIVNISLRAPADAAAAHPDFADYRKTLGLEEAPAEPFKYYRKSRRYALKKGRRWTPGTNPILAAALRQALTAAYGDPPQCVLMSARIVQGQAAADQFTYENLDEFVREMGTRPEYQYAQLYLQGRKGTDLAVWFDREKGTIGLRSSTADGELFKGIAKP